MLNLLGNDVIIEKKDAHILNIFDTDTAAWDSSERLATLRSYLLRLPFVRGRTDTAKT